MDFILGFLNYLISFKVYVLLPVIFFVFSIFFRMKISIAVRACLLVGVGFIGIFVIFGYFVDKVGVVVQDIVKNSGIERQVLDVGWPPLSALAWSYSLVLVVIMIIIVTNLLLVFTKIIKTINIDIFNYWHIIFIAMLINAISGNVYMAMLGAFIANIIILFVSDYVAPKVQKELQIDGITSTTTCGIMYYPVGVLINKIFDKIPYIKKINIDADSLGNKLGIFGEPLTIAFIIGGLFGLFGGYDIKGILELAFNFAAFIFILPKMCEVLGSGIIIIIDGIKGFILSKAQNANFYIGLDQALLVGKPAVIVTALLLMPIVMILGFTLPGVNFIPLGDMGNLIGLIVFIVLATNGNIFRSMIISIPIIIGHMYAASSMAMVYTNLVKDRPDIVNGYSGMITSLGDGGLLFRVWMVKIFTGNSFAIFLAVILVLFILGYLLIKFKKNRRI